MSMRCDTASLISGALVCGNRGLGVLGSQVPASGDAGPGYLYNDLSLPADASKEVRGLIVTPPAAGSLVADEDSSFTFAAPDGIYSFVYRLFVDGADLGTATVTLTIGVTVQIARPIADISNTGWVPSTGTELHPMIGETVRDDGTYISATAVGALCEVGLSSIADPNVSTDHSLPPLVLSAPGGGGITVRLRQGTTTIASWTYHPGPTPTEYTPTLSGAEADSITDYTALRLQFEAIA